MLKIKTEIKNQARDSYSHLYLLSVGVFAVQYSAEENKAVCVSR